MPEIVTYNLEMKSPQMLKEKPKPDGFDVLETEIKQYLITPEAQPSHRSNAT
jgi:hypothetical protein